MAQTIITLQLAFSGKTPIAAGDKRLTALNIAELMYALGHGSRYREPGTSPTLQYQTSVVKASATATCASVVSGNTITIGGQALTAAQRRATGTITAASAIAGDTVTIAGQIFTAVAGAAVLGEATFSIDTGNNATAASIVAQVNAYGGNKIFNRVAARAASAVVTIYAVAEGTSGNAFTLASSDGATLAVSGATLANGAAASNNTFDFAGSNTTTAASLAAAINASTTTAVKQVSATSALAVTTITAKVGGVAGNAITLTQVGGTITLTGAGFLASGAADSPLSFTY